MAFCVQELVLDSTDKERSGLAVRRMKRLLAPAAQENPIFMHLTANPTDTKAVEAAIDQMQEVGFEMIIYSFGSGFQIESSDPGYISKIKASIDYAKSHGNIEVGAYDLIAETRNPPNGSWASISPETGGHDGNACFASGWRDYLLAGVMRFVSETGLTAIETDGPCKWLPCCNAPPLDTMMLCRRRAALRKRGARAPQGPLRLRVPRECPAGTLLPNPPALRHVHPRSRELLLLGSVEIGHGLQ